MYGLTLLLAIPLGKYIANVFKPESANGPIERFIYRLAGIDSSRDMTWKENLVALLTINAVWLGFAFTLLLIQGSYRLIQMGIHHDARSGVQYSHQFHGQLRLATLFG